MRIFVYEHVAGGGACDGPLPTSLAREGLAMLGAVAADLARIDGAEVTLTLDHRLAPLDLPARTSTVRVSSPASSQATFDSLARWASGTLVIAPELDGDLARLARRVEQAGGRHLGSTPDAIEAACDKLRLPQLLAAVRVPCVPAEAYSGRAPGAFDYPLVVKPRRGAGSTEVRCVHRPRDLPDVRRESVVTPFLPGLPASVLVLAGAHRLVPLEACEQILSADGSLCYLGGRLPLEPELSARAQDLAVRAVGAIPGLLGFVGVDLILARDGDATGDTVVEINARLTTSYVGLRCLAATNLAAAWLALVEGAEPPPIRWECGSVRFRPEGTAERELAGSVKHGGAAC